MNYYGLAFGALLGLAIAVAVPSCGQQSAPQKNPTAATVITNDRGRKTDIQTVHDDRRAVTCWYAEGGYGGSSPAISCLPDSQLAPR